MRRITWLGHATVVIETGDGVRLVTDPVLGRRVGHLRRQGAALAVEEIGPIDGVLVSHAHHDHLDRGSLRRLGEGTGRRGPATVPIVVPRGTGRHVGSLPFGPVHEVSAGETITIDGAAVRAVPAWHPTRRWPRSAQLDAVGYVVDGIWFAGDTDLDERMAELRGTVDVALVPIWGWGASLGPGHLDPAGAARAVALVEPRIAVPIHWGTFLPYGLGRRHRRLLTAPAREFAAHAARYAPSVRVETLSPGAPLALDPRAPGQRS